ncbi:ABC transporter ATP-binding protein [Ruegeria sp. R13_0]|nr:ABC transporter ATP-binding protein [Ruegeria sp. R13_0]
MIEFYKSILRTTGHRQVVNILLSLAIAALAAFPLNYQKEIVNGLTEKNISPGGLLWLGAAMGALITLSLALKWVLGYLSSVLGEDMIRKLRKRICNLSRENPAGSEKVAYGAKATMVSAEAEQVGKFSGSALSEPIVQAGTLVVIVGYIAANQPSLGLIAIGMIIPQVFIVLLVQTRVNSLVSDRVHTLRKATNWLVDPDRSAAEITPKFDEIYDTRSRIFVWKLSSKFVLSAINGAGTVGVLVVGGWQVLEGNTDVGTVVAATVGLTRLQGPTRQLIAFYRQVSATAVKFELLREAGVDMADATT